MFFTGQKTQPTVSKYWRKIYKGKQPPKHKENISQKTWQQAVTLQAVIFSGCLVYFWVVSNVVYFDVVLFLLLRAVFADIFSHRWIVCCSYCALTVHSISSDTHGLIAHCLAVLIRLLWMFLLTQGMVMYSLLMSLWRVTFCLSLGCSNSVWPSRLVFHVFAQVHWNA